MVRWTNTFYIECKILPKEWVDMACKSQNILPSGIIPKNFTAMAYIWRITKNMDGSFTTAACGTDFTIYGYIAHQMEPSAYS